MFRVVGRRLGGRIGKSGGSALLLATSTAATAPRPSSTPSTTGMHSLVDVVLPRVDCSLLKHVLSSSSSSSTSTDIPDVARVLRFDYTAQDGHPKKKKASGAGGGATDGMMHPLADILLVNRIHAAVITDTKKHARKGEMADDSTAPAPLLVLVETTLTQEDADVQQFIIRNALRMHPLPATVEVQPRTAKKDLAGLPRRVPTPPLTVLILGAELTERVRTLAKLPAQPSPIPLPPENETICSIVPGTKENVLKETVVTAVQEEEELMDQNSAEVVEKVTEEPEEPAEPTPATSVDVPPVEQKSTPPQVQLVAPAVDAAPPTKRKKASRGKSAAAASPSRSPSSRVRSSPRKTKQQQLQKGKKRAAALLHQHAAARWKKKEVRNRKQRAARTTHKRTQRRPSVLKEALQPMPSQLPRLLSVDDTTEKVLWASRPGHPLPLAILAPLISPAIFQKMCAAASSASHKISAGRGAEDAPLSLHTVVYRAGIQSSAQTVWLGAVQAAAEVAVALSQGTSLLPAAITELTAQSHAFFTVDAPRSRPGRSSSSSFTASSRTRTNSVENARSGRGRSASKRKPSSDVPAAVEETTWIYLLIHTSLSPQDAAVLQQELDYQYAQLKATPAGAELAGISVLTTQDVSPTHLWYVLEHGTTHKSTAANLEAATSRNNARSTVPWQNSTALGRSPASPEGAEMSRVFQDVYRMLTEQPELLPPSLLLSTTTTTGEMKHTIANSASVREVNSGAASKRHPDALVSEALRIAALTHVLVQRKEAQLREEFAALQQRSAVSADSEAVARAAQKVEIKTMVTEAVEEVSVRHEQATAHLVKTLSSMVGQWSLEKLSDTLEAIMRDEVKPILDVLEERLGNNTQQQQQRPPSSYSTEEADTVAKVAEEGLTATTPTVTETESHSGAKSSGAKVALLEGPGEMRDTLEKILAQLRELSERASALSTAAETTPATMTDGKDEETWTLNAQRAVDEERLLQALRDLQQQNQVELQQTLGALKEDLRSAWLLGNASVQSGMENTVPTTAAATVVSPEVVESAVARAVEDVSVAICQGIRKSVANQLDSYCEMHRSRQNENKNSSNGGEGEPSLPILPVTSFELEEMLTRTVNFAMREASNEIEGHLRTAMEKALHGFVATTTTFTTSTLSSSGADSDDKQYNPNNNASNIDNKSSMKAALEELLAQVKAEAAEEEAVKLSQHNRQLLRLFRRRQHLWKVNGNSMTTADGKPFASSDAGLTLLAVEQAVRTTMQPYMTQMQAALTTVTAHSHSTSNPASSSSPSLQNEK